MRELELFETNSIIYKKFLPIVTKLEETPISMNVWDIPYTIKDLSYLVHSHYRYYGKFPSVVAGQLLEMFPAPSKDHYVLDNFCGSGTTLVEARLRGIKSFGLDISWLSCLASNVKVKPIDVTHLVHTWKTKRVWFLNQPHLLKNGFLMMRQQI
jgi:DNA modification methylase